MRRSTELRVNVAHSVQVSGIHGPHRAQSTFLFGLEQVLVAGIGLALEQLTRSIQRMRQTQAIELMRRAQAIGAMTHQANKLAIAGHDVLDTRPHIQVRGAAPKVLGQLAVLAFALLPTGGDSRHAARHTQRVDDLIQRRLQALRPNQNDALAHE